MSPMPQHERHERLQAALQAGSEMLRVPEVARQLGEYATDLARIQARIVTPDIQNGVVVLDGYRSNAIPAVAVHVGERVYREPQDLLFDAQQRYHINKKYKSGLAREIFAVFADHYDGRKTGHATGIDFSDIAATVDSDIVEPEEDSWQIYMRGRPIVAFNLDIDQSCNRLDVIHEQTHLLHIMREPLSTTPFDQYNSCLSHELEAYHVAAQVILGYTAAGRLKELTTNDAEYEVAKTTQEIEKTRLRHQMPGKSPFAVSQALIDDLHDNGLYINAADVS